MTKHPRTRATLTPKQSKAAQLVQVGLSAGTPLSSDLITQAHAEAYGVDQKTASTLGARNMRNPLFQDALELTSDEARQRLNGVLWSCLNGNHPIWPKDKSLFVASMKIMARAIYAEKLQIVDTDGDAESRSIEELEYRLANYPHWPTPEQLRFYREHGDWPEKIIVN